MVLDFIGIELFWCLVVDLAEMLYLMLMSSSGHGDNKKKDILILGEVQTQGLHNTTLTAEKHYSINFIENGKNFVLRLHHNGVNSYVFVNGVEIIKFKAKDSEIKPTPLHEVKASKNFSV